MPRIPRRRFPAAAALVALFCSSPAGAQIPAVILEACNAMQPAAKRLECLRAANQNGTAGGGKTYSTTQVPSTYVAPPQQAADIGVTPVVPIRPGSYPQSTGTTCHVGPRGGTYTITASGRKNYGGC